MTPRTVSTVALVALSAACAPSVRVPVLQPAMVAIPADVRTIGIIDRSAPANAGEGILGTIEGVLTGEGILADREGAAESLTTLTYVLGESPRFEIVTPSLDGREAHTGIFDDVLDHRTVAKICRQAGCDALLALESFDTDSALSIDGNPIDPRQIYTEVTVARDTRVLTAWRLYDADEDRILDEVRGWERSQSWDQYGDTLDEALRQLPSPQDTAREVGGWLGDDYARRIAPTWVDVSRDYYGGGDPRLKEAKYYVQARDWDGATEIWEVVALDPDPKVAGKASFNLALASEIDGDLRQALEHAKKAAVDLHNGKSRDYVWILESRIRDQAKLEAQLAPPTPEPSLGKPTSPGSATNTSTHAAPSSGDGANQTMTRGQ